MSQHAILITGTQLWDKHPALDQYPDAPVIMVEAQNLLQKHRYHTHKLVLILSAMRSYRDWLQDQGRTVIYHEFTESGRDFLQVIRDLVDDHDIHKLTWMKTSDYHPQQQLLSLCEAKSIDSDVLPNKLFLTPAVEFEKWYQSQKNPVMENFYRQQRRNLDLLMTDNDKPEGGQWNFDKSNRKPLPKDGIEIPPLPDSELTQNDTDVIELIKTHFNDNPGNPDDFWLPTTRRASLHWLNRFLDERFKNFGDYEDAMHPDEAFLFHSVLSPMMNIGLIHPQEVVDKAIEAFRAGKTDISAVEGFVRQIIGWREYMHGIYWQRMPQFRTENYFGFDNKLADWWWTGETDITPLDSLLPRLFKYGYAHHIERLMVYSNYMLMAETNPMEVYDWFMSMFVDAYDWVMVPNAIGMGQCADGGNLATKPYIAAGNYLHKMGRFWDSGAKARESVWNDMYWEFLKNNKPKLEKFHRLKPILSRLD